MPPVAGQAAKSKNERNYGRLNCAGQCEHHASEALLRIELPLDPEKDAKE